MSNVRRASYLLIAVLGAALIVSLVWRPAPPSPFLALPADAVPLTLGTFIGEDSPVDAGTLQALQSAQLFSRQYTSETGFVVTFALIAGTDRNALHDPRSCLIGAGDRIDRDRLETLRGAGIRVRACDVMFGDDADQGGEDTLYWYYTRDGVISSATDIRMKLLWSGLVMQRGDPIYFLRFMTPISGKQTAAQRAGTHKRLEAFAFKMWRAVLPSLTRTSPVAAQRATEVAPIEGDKSAFADSTSRRGRLVRAGDRGRAY